MCQTDLKIINKNYNIFKCFKLTRAICISNRISLVTEVQTKFCAQMVKTDNSMTSAWYFNDFTILESYTKINSEQSNIPGLEIKK